ncbi:response regulator [Pendulispora albinea]|uniref:Response regulator n=1 Tax=Pendulispora albinea TaxID=2741071 RepID=A0ABZ2M1J2_9BACT
MSPVLAPDLQGNEHTGPPSPVIRELPMIRKPASATMMPSRDPRAAKPAGVSSPLSGLHILVVDDDADNRRLLQKILEHRGSRITTACNVADAMAAFEREKPDVLLSDIGMPGENGYDLIRRVRALPRDRGGTIPAAALTACAEDEDREHALRAGFMAHLPKPFNPTELVTMVTSLARKAA